MIIELPVPRYKCSKCGSMRSEKFSEPPKTRYSGYYEGIRCLECDHESKWYIESIWEKECSSDNVYSSDNTYSAEPQKPVEF